MDEVYNDIELFKIYLRDWSELYIHFCWHKNETPKQTCDRSIFKNKFTFERWKQGFSNYTKNEKYVPKTEDTELLDLNVRITYNMFHFVPFNIRKQIT